MTAVFFICFQFVWYVWAFDFVEFSLEFSIFVVDQRTDFQFSVLLGVRDDSCLVFLFLFFKCFGVWEVKKLHAEYDTKKCITLGSGTTCG